MATMPLGTGAELSTGQRAACQYHNLLQKTTSMGSGGSRTEDRRYDAGAGRFISEDFIKGHTAVPYTMNHYSYCFNRPMDLVDLKERVPLQYLINLKYTDEELEPLYQIWFAQNSILVNHKNAWRKTPLEIAEQMPYRASLLERMKKYE